MRERPLPLPLPLLRFRSSASAPPLPSEMKSSRHYSGVAVASSSLYPFIPPLAGSPGSSRVSALPLLAPCSLLHALLPIAQAVKYWPSRVFFGPLFFSFLFHGSNYFFVAARGFRVRFVWIAIYRSHTHTHGPVHRNVRQVGGYKMFHVSIGVLLLLLVLLFWIKIHFSTKKL